MLTICLSQITWNHPTFNLWLIRLAVARNVLILRNSASCALNIMKPSYVTHWLKMLLNSSARSKGKRTKNDVSWKNRGIKVTNEKIKQKTKDSSECWQAWEVVDGTTRETLSSQTTKFFNFYKIFLSNLKYNFLFILIYKKVFGMRV